jgi:hypothetical protein
MAAILATPSSHRDTDGAARLAALSQDAGQRALVAAYESFLHAPTLPPAPGQRTVVLVRGLFGAWIPQHFRAPLARLRALGRDAVIARTTANGTIEANRRALVAQTRALVDSGRRPVFLAHSKAGLEVLLALAGEPALLAATAGFVGVQMPRAGAPCLESMFGGAHRATRRTRDALRESAEGMLLTVLGARPACRELDGRTVAALAAQIDRCRWPFPWLAVATHAARPTRSLELRHDRLGRIAPGELHDGVFRTVDQVWPRGRTLLLPDIDHAQPSVGGRGFAHDRFWCALLGMLESRDLTA